MSSVPRLARVLGMMVLVASFAPMAHAQYRIVGGHALDANPRVGGAGFNTRVSTRAPGLQSPVYRYDATGAARQNYTMQRPAPTRPAYPSYGRPTSAVSYGGSYATASVGRGGLNTTGYALSTPTYNPLSAPTYVDRMPTGLPSGPAVSVAMPGMGLTSPSYTAIRSGQ